MFFFASAISRLRLAKSLMMIHVLIISACVPITHTNFPVTPDEQATLSDEEFNIVLLSPQNIRTYGPASSVHFPSDRLPSIADNWRYRVGVGDILSITVWDHPELTLPAGPERNQIESGSWVNADGEIFYPYIGKVRVAGQTIQTIQDELTARLSEYIPDPQIEVKVAVFNSQKVILTGAIENPGSAPITNIPLTLLDALNTAGGLTIDADSRQVSILRNDRVYRINLDLFLNSATPHGNPILVGGDIVNVSAQEDNFAYVLGQVAQPGAVELGTNSVTLTDALTLSGGLDQDTADVQGVFVFRNQNMGSGVDVFQLDASTPLAFVLATEFSLRTQDVVYVVSDPAAKWNAIIARILPSLTAIRGFQTIGGDL